MRRHVPTLLLTLVAVAATITVASAPAGATGWPVHDLHPSSGPSRSFDAGHVTSQVPPLTNGYVEVLDDSGNLAYAPSAVQAPNDSTGTGSEMDLQSSVDIPGVGPDSVSVEISTGSPSQPITAGQVYGTGFTGSVDVAFSGGGCVSFGYAEFAIAEVDQFTEVAGVITSAAVQVLCVDLLSSVPFLYSVTAYDAVPTTPHQGYYTYQSDGALTPFGNDSYLNYLGDLSAFPLDAPIVGMAQTTDAAGYWMVASDGGIFAYGDAGFYGSMGGTPLNQPIVGMAATPDGRGYWLVAADGGVFAFGDAGFYGSMGGTHLNQPIVGMAAAPDGRGYWLVAADGGVFAFGDAPFYGSTGNIHLDQPVVGMTPTPDGRGYWFVAADGGIFAYGDAAFHGSTGGTTLNEPIVGMAATPSGGGYWLVAGDGGIFGFGDAPYDGSLPADGNDLDDVAGIST